MTGRPVQHAAHAIVRALGVMLVLLGVVAMHQLAGGNHLSAHETHSAPGAPVISARAMGGVASTTTPLQGADIRAVTAADSTAPSDHPGDHDAMLMCLAVLAGLLTLLAPSAGGLTASPTRTLGSRARTGRSGRGPPRVLLAQICVLRA